MSQFNKFGLVLKERLMHSTYILIGTYLLELGIVLQFPIIIMMFFKMLEYQT